MVRLVSQPQFVHNEKCSLPSLMHMPVIITRGNDEKYPTMLHFKKLHFFFLFALWNRISWSPCYKNWTCSQERPRTSDRLAQASPVLSLWVSVIPCLISIDVHVTTKRTEPQFLQFTNSNNTRTIHKFLSSFFCKSLRTFWVIPIVCQHSSKVNKRLPLWLKKLLFYQVPDEASLKADL